MKYSKMADEFVLDLDKAVDEIAFVGAATQLCENLGFRWFIYAHLSGDQPIVISTYPKAWCDHYLANGYENCDPVVVTAQRTRSAFAWSARDTDTTEDPAAARVLDEAASIGIQTGVTVSLQEHKGRSSVFTVAGDSSTKSFEDLPPDLISCREQCCIEFDRQMTAPIERFASVAVKTTLTPRQRTCLLAAADGHSAKQAARHTGLTPRTVQHHFDEAKRRLSAQSLPHAVAVALRSGLIS